MRYEFTRLLVPNFADCFRFYRDILGLTPIFGSEGDGYGEFSTGAVSITLFDQREMAEATGTADRLPAASPDAVCLVFGVDDLEAFVAELTARGATPAVPITDHPDWGIRTVHYRDPAGNLLEFNCPRVA